MAYSEDSILLIYLISTPKVRYGMADNILTKICVDLTFEG